MLKFLAPVIFSCVVNLTHQQEKTKYEEGFQKLHDTGQQTTHKMFSPLFFPHTFRFIHIM